MTRTKKLAPVVEHVERNETSALQAVAFSQQQLQHQQQQLQQLLDYRHEYQQRGHSGSSFTAVQFSEFNRFLAQLDDTIAQQRQIVEMARREVEVKVRNWKLSRSRSDAMHKMIDRLQAHESRQQEQSEQKLMDELALRTVLKNQ